MSDSKRLPPSTIAPFALRLQPTVKARLETEAGKNGRSLNAEIAARLEASLSSETEIEKRIAAIEQDLARLWSHFVAPPAGDGSGLAERLRSSAARKAKE